MRFFRRAFFVASVTASFGVGCGALVDLSAYRACEGNECGGGDSSNGDVSTDAGVADTLASDVAAEAFSGATPKDLFGTDLALWLDGAKGVLLSPSDAGTVQSWQDQSLYQAVASQPVEAHQPTLNPTGVAGHPSLGFPTSFHGMSVADAVQLRFGLTNDFLIEALVQLTNDQGAMLYLWNKALEVGVQSSSFTDGLMFGFAFDPQVTSDPMTPMARMVATPGQIAAFGTITPGVPHVLGVRRIYQSSTQALLQVRVDGKLTSNALDPQGVDLDNTPVRIGGYKLKGLLKEVPTDLEIAELVAVSKATISDGEVSLVESYFKVKYGL